MLYMLHPLLELTLTLGAGLLEVAHGIVDSSGLEFSSVIFSPPALALLANLLSESHLEPLYNWPEKEGGGKLALAALLQRLSAVLRVPVGLCGGGENDDGNGYIKLVLEVGFVGKIVENVFGGFRGRVETAHWSSAVDLLSRLVLLKNEFVEQFIQAGGLKELKAIGGLDGNGPSRMVVNCLLICSQLARSSGEYYSSMKSANIIECCGSLLHHEEGGVRAKTCNLLGNMFRHSDFFYSDFKGDLELVARLTECCGDKDGKTRKVSERASGVGGGLCAFLMGRSRERAQRAKLRPSSQAQRKADAQRKGGGNGGTQLNFQTSTKQTI